MTNTAKKKKKKSKVETLVIIEDSVPSRRHVTILNVYAPNISTKEHTLKHIQEEYTELKEVDNFIISWRSAHIPLRN